jgi:hypothetical protein
LREVSDEIYWALIFGGNIPIWDNDVSAEFIEAAMDCTPEIKSFVDQNLNLSALDRTTLDTQSITQSALKYIVTSLRADIFGRRLLQSYYNKFIEHHADDFIETFNNTHGRRILFTSLVPYFHILRESIALRKQGFSTYLIALDMQDEEMTALFEDNFDAVLTLPNNLEILGAVLSQLEPELIHIQCTQLQLNTPFYRYVLEHKGNAKAVCAWRDILSLFINKDTFDAEMPDMSDYSYNSERIAFELGDGHTCRFSKHAREILRQRYPNAGPIIEMHPYPSTEFFDTRTKKYSDADGTPHIVFAGQVSHTNPDGTSTWPRIRSISTNMPNLVKRMTAQGIKVDLLMLPEQSRDDPGLIVFREMEEVDTNFRLLEGVPPSRLANTLTRYDFGFNLAAMHRDDLDDELTHYDAIGTKQFSYLEAGIPVILSAEFEHAARLINEEGLGITIAFEDLNTLAQKIRDFDYQNCLENIRRYNQEHNMDREVWRLIDLYENLVPEWKLK